MLIFGVHPAGRLKFILNDYLDIVLGRRIADLPLKSALRLVTNLCFQLLDYSAYSVFCYSIVAVFFE